MKKKAWFLVALLSAILLCAAPCLGAEHEGARDTGKTKEITVEGTIQGLLTTCAGKTCQPGQEHIVAAMEDDYVLVADSGGYYLLPNLKSSQLSRHLNKRVKVSGVQVVGGNVILVNTAQVMEGGKWVDFHSRKMLDDLDELMYWFPY
jgi:hypothetical protein